MSAFKFSLQRVLDVRMHVEDEKKSDFAMALKIVEDAKIFLDNILLKREATSSGLEEHFQNGKIDLLTVQRTRSYLKRLAEEILNQRNLIIEKEKILEEKRAVMIKARQDRMVLEKLGEKEREKYFKESLKKEQNLLDEISNKGKESGK